MWNRGASIDAMDPFVILPQQRMARGPGHSQWIDLTANPLAYCWFR
jgi:hypothetical protein